jgi:hypothetical protein
MDERELGQRVKALTKCVAANEPPENAIKLLETLKKDASPTEEMLRVRQITSGIWRAQYYLDFEYIAYCQLCAKFMIALFALSAYREIFNM